MVNIYLFLNSNIKCLQATIFHHQKSQAIETKEYNKKKQDLCACVYVCRVKCRKTLPGNCQLSWAQREGVVGVVAAVVVAVVLAVIVVVVATVSCQLHCALTVSVSVSLSACVSVSVCVGCANMKLYYACVCLSSQTNKACNILLREFTSSAVAILKIIKQHNNNKNQLQREIKLG